MQEMPARQTHHPERPSSINLEVRFYKRGEPFFCFTNFSEHPVSLGGRSWRTTEHFFQAQKFSTTDPASFDAVWSAATPKEAAAIGRERSRPLRADWEAVKDDIMRIAVFTKISSYPEIRDLLMGTGEAMIIEDSPYDSYWGSGADGTGRNMLGKILMEARSILKAGDLVSLQNRTDELISKI